MNDVEEGRTQTPLPGPDQSPSGDPTKQKSKKSLWPSLKRQFNVIRNFFWGIIEFFIKHYQANNQIYSLTINIILALGFMACSVSIVILFVKPDLYTAFPSFIDASSPGIKPTTATNVLATLLAGVTLSLSCRWVEHYLWLQLNNARPTKSQPGLPIKEVGQLATWTTSALDRGLYILSGSSWLLKASSVLLLFSAVGLGPVLISGITPISLDLSYIAPLTSSSLQGFNSSDSDYIGFTDELTDIPANTDIFTAMAASLSLQNIKPPSGEVRCQTETCWFSGFVPALRANCSHHSGTGDQISSGTNGQFRTFHSDWDTTVEVSLSGSWVDTFANFTTSRPPTSVSNEGGVIASILGAWSIPDFENNSLIFNVVQCQVLSGYQWLIQEVDGTPLVEDRTFLPVEFKYSDNLVIGRLMDYYVNSYADVDSETSANPFIFSHAREGSIQKLRPISRLHSRLLLNPYGDASAETVANRIEGIWQMTTYLAWSRYPDKGTRHTTREIVSKYTYQYNKWVLLCLLAPFFSLCLVGWATKMANGPKLIVSGYNPIAIAARGPVVLDHTTDSLGLENEYGYINDDIADQYRVRNFDSAGTGDTEAFKKMHTAGGIQPRWRTTDA